MNHKTMRTLLTGLSCVGVVATMIFTRQCSIKADEVRRNELLVSKRDILKKTGPHYIPALICGGATIAVILFNDRFNAKYAAGLVSAAGASGRFFHEFEAKARDILGEEKVKEVHRAIARDHENGIVVAAIPDLYAPGLMTCVSDPVIKGDQLFYDEFTNIWFRSSFAAVKCAEYHLNRNYALGDDITLKKFYEFLGVGLPEEFNGLSWTDILYTDGVNWLDFNHLEAFSKEKNEQYFIISYEYPPIVGIDENGEIEFFKRR